MKMKKNDFLSIKLNGFLLICLMLSGYVMMGQSWVQKQKVTASTRNVNDYFSRALDAENRWLISGTKDSYDVNGANYIQNAGAAYIYLRDSTGKYKEMQKLVALHRAHGGDFGLDVAMHGNQILVAAGADPYDTLGLNYLLIAGAYYLYEIDTNGIWTFKQKMVSPYRRALSSAYGESDCDMDGIWAIVSDPLESVDSNGLNPITSSGLVFCHKINNQGKRTLKQQLNAHDRYSLSAFGAVLTLNVDQLFVSDFVNPTDDNDQNFMTAAGAIYVFDLINGRWQETQKIAFSNRDTSDQFGEVLDADGNWMAVGMQEYALDSSLTVQTEAGVVVLFEKGSNGKWTEKQIINSSDVNADEEFGASIVIYDSTLIVGARKQNYDTAGANYEQDAGSLYRFKLNPQGAWVEKEKMVSEDRQPIDLLGSEVVIDGNYAIAGALLEDHDTLGLNTVSNSGSLYVFSPCKEEYTTVNSFLCEGDSIYVAGYWISQPGVYIDSLQSAVHGCDSVIMNVVLSPELSDSVVNLGKSLVSLTANASYTWFNCMTGEIYTSDTNNAFTPNQDGTYAVAVSKNGCTDTSSCHTVIGVDINEIYEQNEIRIFPNPINKFLTIESNYSRIQEVKIYDVSGKIVFENSISSFLERIDLHGLNVGIYVIRIQSEDGVYVKKIQKK